MLSIGVCCWALYHPSTSKLMPHPKAAQALDRRTLAWSAWMLLLSRMIRLQIEIHKFSMSVSGIVNCVPHDLGNSPEISGIVPIGC